MVRFHVLQSMQIATKTIEAIDHNLELDGGAKFRGYFKEALSEISDAFNDTPDLLPRTHLGGSLIGRKCWREIWYGFRWAVQKKIPARIIRLFQRGHLEEGRFIALVRTAGMQSWHSHDGKQFRISDHGGHYGGSLDGVAIGCLDIPSGEAALLEFKTHGKKSFEKLKKIGVREAKPEHYAQCNQYMGKFNLNWTIYMAVEKDTDDLHIEVFPFDRVNYEQHLEKALQIILAQTPPARMQNASPTHYECKYCDSYSVCHYGEKALPNCRTCSYSEVRDGGIWHCNFHDTDQDKHAQFAGCDFHNYIPGL